MAEHVGSLKTYYLIFAVLIVLALATTAIAFVDLGPLNPVIAFVIATVKATLVVLYFMHVKFERRLTLVFAMAGFCWLAIFIVLTFGDYLTRGWLPAPGALRF
jgi:cytochrome c oxidase subunit 4